MGFAAQSTYMSEQGLEQYRKRMEERKKQMLREIENGRQRAPYNGKVWEEEKKEEVKVGNELVGDMLAEAEDDYNSAESVDSDELEGALNLSDNEDQAIKFREKMKAKAGRSKHRHYKAEVDTNVSIIDFNKLKDQAEMATGDPYFCGHCRSVLNVYSKIEEEKEG